MNKKIKNNFTLVEIAIVLLVLVALAGITVPLALNYGQRSHGSTGAGNMAQLTSNINRFQAETFAYPDDWDNLVDDQGELYDTGGGAFSKLALVPATVDALKEAGINNIHPILDQDAGNQVYQTFGGTATPIAVADTIEVVEIDGNTVNSVLGGSNDATDTYVAFGIGENLSAVGKTMASAPYDFPEGAEKPEDSYKRFIAVFNVSGEGAAKFVGVVANDEGSITNIQDHINEFYEAGE